MLNTKGEALPTDNLKAHKVKLKIAVAKYNNGRHNGLLAALNDIALVDCTKPDAGARIRAIIGQALKDYN